MAYIYTLNYIRDNKSITSLQSEPQLISFSKIRDDVTPDQPRNFHPHAHLEIFYFESGTGFFETPTEKVPLKGNDIVVINANQIHCQYSESEPALIYYGLDILGLKLEGLPENSISEAPYLKFSLKTKQNVFYSCLQNILRELNRADKASAFKIKGLTYQILAELLRLKDTGKNEAKPSGNFTFLLNEILRYLGDHYAENIPLDELAKKFFLSESSLCHHFQRELQITPRKYVLKLRLDRARTLLGKTDLSINEIARRVGFQSNSYFTRYFKKTQHGMSPQAYRNQRRTLHEKDT